MPAALHASFEALAHGAVDMAIGYGAAKPDGRQNFELFRDTLVAVLPADHPSTARSATAAGDMAGETYVSAAPVIERRFAYQAFLLGAGIAPAQIL